MDPSFEEDLDCDRSSAGDPGLLSPGQSDCSLASSGHLQNPTLSSGIGSISSIFPHDSISQRPPRSESSEVSAKALGDEDDLFRVVHGRQFASQNEVYMLPSDGIEHNRQDIQHRLLQLSINSLYYPVSLVKRALTPSTLYEAPGVLDVGTGSGRWALDMALEFPHAECVGMDLVPPALMGVGNVPPNCRFEIDDANLSFSHYASKFNVIHMRTAHPGINDFDSFLHRVAEALKPRGVLLLSAGSPQFCGENFEPLPTVEEGQLGFTWLQRLHSETVYCYLNRGCDSNSPYYWHQWLENNPNYENVVTKDIYIPLGPWLSGMDERQAYVSELMRYCISHVSNSFKALLVTGGHESDKVDRWVINAQSELRDLTIHAYVKWRHVWAERRECAWTDRPETPKPVHNDSQALW